MIKVADDRIAEAREILLREHDAKKPPDPPADHKGDMMARINAENALGWHEQQRWEIEGTNRLNAVAHESTWDRTLEGPPETVLHDLDIRDVRTLTVEAPSGYTRGEYRLQIIFNKIEGVRYQATAREPAWLSATLELIARELKRSRPGYTWMRQPFVALCLFLAIGALILLLVNAILAPDPWVLVIIGSAAFFVAAGLSDARLYATLFLPGFEITDPEHKGRGSRAMGLLGALGVLAATLVLEALLL